VTYVELERTYLDRYDKMYNSEGTGNRNRTSDCLLDSSNINNTARYAARFVAKCGNEARHC
jgi:hypothetical protein